MTAVTFVYYFRWVAVLMLFLTFSGVVEIALQWLAPKRIFHISRQPSAALTIVATGGVLAAAVAFIKMT